ncbi:MAG: cell envelope integrity protein CreD [Saprospiraceae bacterium]|nr:cell envelope integrity protein CreD [Saprospiraceae bacterium]
MESTQPNTPEPSFIQRNGTTLKGIIIFFLMLVLLIPTSMVESLIYERQGRHNEAINEVSSKWGQSQTLSGPILVLPYEQTQRSTDGKEVFKETKFACFLPDELRVNGQINPEKRHRGIFDVVLYSSRLKLEGSFNAPEVEKLVPAGATVLWDKASLVLGIPDLRGLEDQVTLQWDGQASMFDPGIPVSGLLQSGIHVPIALKAAALNKAAGSHSFKIELALKGSGALFFTPVGKVTDVKIASPWADPSFTGAFLPDEKTVSPAGFEASWKVLNLNRNYPQQWTSEAQMNFSESTFGVDFLIPVDNYQKSTRSVKYAILFICLTFLTIFFIEMGQSRRVHPFQYALIGLALVIFYTLLVSISEHLSFNAAYFIAAVMTIGMTGLYARSLFQSNRMALFVCGTMTVLYGFLFVVLQQQDYALLIGSLGLFAILAVVMYVSRRINWQG